MYPPKEVSFEIGSTPETLLPVPGRYTFQVTDRPQFFSLPGCSPLGRFLRIRLHGMRQRQLEVTCMLAYEFHLHFTVFARRVITFTQAARHACDLLGLKRHPFFNWASTDT